MFKFGGPLKTWRGGLSWLGRGLHPLRAFFPQSACLSAWASQLLSLFLRGFPPSSCSTNNLSSFYISLLFIQFFLVLLSSSVVISLYVGSPVPVFLFLHGCCNPSANVNTDLPNLEFPFNFSTFFFIYFYIHSTSILPPVYQTKYRFAHKPNTDRFINLKLDFKESMLNTELFRPCFESSSVFELYGQT